MVFMGVGKTDKDECCRSCGCWEPAETTLVFKQFEVGDAIINKPTDKAFKLWYCKRCSIDAWRARCANDIRQMDELLKTDGAIIMDAQELMQVKLDV